MGVSGDFQELFGARGVPEGKAVYIMMVKSCFVLFTHVLTLSVQ